MAIHQPNWKGGAGAPQAVAVPEHSRKPEHLYKIIEECSPGPYLELFARGTRVGWHAWGNQAEQYDITWDTYRNNSASVVPLDRRRRPG